jgi:hypothetical protein
MLKSLKFVKFDTDNDVGRCRLRFTILKFWLYEFFFFWPAIVLYYIIIFYYIRLVRDMNI